LILEGVGADVKAEQPVLYGGGLVGKIDAAGAGSAHVRLLTDTGFTVTGQFVRFAKTDSGIQAQRITQLIPIVRGIGGGQMIIANLAMQDILTLQPDDWLVLSDPTWPAAIQGIRLGKIASIQRSRTAALYVEIRLSPEAGLMRLNDVWVMTKEGK
jgi:cell shape-determining protein MreC